MSCAVTYPLGLVGVILALLLMRIVLRRWEPRTEGGESGEEPFIASFCVCNPAIFRMNLHDVSAMSDSAKFVVSRLWRGGKVILPTGDSTLEEGDRILVITQKRFVDRLTIFFGRRDETVSYTHLTLPTTERV